MAIDPATAGFRIRRGVVTALIATLAKGTAGSMRAIEALLKGYDENPNIFYGANENIAKAMQTRTLQSVLGIDQHSNARGDRPQSRFTGGLERAVRDPDFVAADATHVYFGNETLLATEAKHWRRLNFGTGSNQTSPQRVPIRFDGRVIAQLSFRNPNLPNPTMPRGLFLNEGTWTVPSSAFRGRSGGVPFQPIQKRLQFATVGIKGRHFMDRGLEALRDVLPREYEDVMRRQLRDMTDAGQAMRRVLVKVPSNPYLSL